MRKPNFFIVGAPKSGTSSLAHYLGEHPQIFFCRPKEPYHFCDDYPALQSYYRVETRDRYLRLFARANDGHLAIGEGSTNYLASERAIANILTFSPQARFIAMLRDPIEVVYSWHTTLLNALNEDVEDFEAAWRLQETRSRGQQVPKTCLAPQFLQYRAVVHYSLQVERFLSLVPEKQRKIVFFEDFAADPARIYEETLCFLDVETDGRTTFPRINASKRTRFVTMNRFLRRPPRLLATPMFWLRSQVMSRRSGILGAATRGMNARYRRPALRADFLGELRHCFEADVARLSTLVRRDLRHWLRSNSGEPVVASDP